MKKTFFAMLAVVAMTCSAEAVDWSQQITQLDGKPLLDQAGKPTEVTLGNVVKNSLLYTDQSTKPDDKKKRFWLALKVGDAEEKKKDLVLAPWEITEIEKCLGENQSTLIAGQASKMIDPTFQPPKD